MNTLLDISIKSETETWSDVELVLEALGKKLNIEETLFPGLISLCAEMYDFLARTCEDKKFTISAILNGKELRIRFQLYTTDYKRIKKYFSADESEIKEWIHLLADSCTFHDELSRLELEFRVLIVMERVQEERQKVLKSFYRKSKAIEIHNDKI